MINNELKNPRTHTENQRDTDPSVQNVIQKKDCQRNAEQINLFLFLLST